MNIKIYAIGGHWMFSRNYTSSGDCWVGTATDAITALSLIDLVEAKGGYAVSLHGDGISGEFTLRDARSVMKDRLHAELVA